MVIELSAACWSVFIICVGGCLEYLLGDGPSGLLSYSDFAFFLFFLI
jgi:hypothetical protein